MACYVRMHHTYAPPEDWTGGESTTDADANAPESPDIPREEEAEEEPPLRVEDLADPEADPEMPMHYGYAARNARRFDYGPNYYAANQMYGGQVNTGNDSKYIQIDSHILATPVLSDINGDGHMEVR